MQVRAFFCSIMVCCCIGSGLARASAHGMVAFYAFDEDAGETVRDLSSWGNDGRVIGAVWTEQPHGGVLEFDGADDYVEVPYADIFATLKEAGTVSVWCRPSAPLQGGLACWNTGTKRPDQRLGLMAMTYYGGNRAWTSVADGRNSVVIHDNVHPFVRFGHVEPGEWVHLAMSFDGTDLRAYRDGLLLGAVPQKCSPDVAGVPLWLGRTRGLGSEYFHGVLDEVRVYNRCLSETEVLDLYEMDAPGRIPDTVSLGKPKAAVHRYVVPQKVGVELDLRPMRLPRKTTVSIALTSPGEGAAPVARRALEHVRKGEIIFDVPDLAPGEYIARIAAARRSGEPVGDAVTIPFTWPERPASFRNVKILNNFVWELLNVESADLSIPCEFTFQNPRDGWIHIRTYSPPEGPHRGYSRVWVMLDNETRENATILHSRYDSDSLEAMRFLPAGEHRVRLERDGGATISELTVRRIPSLYHSSMPAGTVISKFDPYDRGFLWEDVLRNVNVMITGVRPADRDIMDYDILADWGRLGREHIWHTGVLRTKTLDEEGVKAAYENWANHPGMQRPASGGIIVDEFGCIDEPYHDVWRQALEKIDAVPELRDKRFIAYTISHYHPSERRDRFYRTLLDTGGVIAPEVYIVEDRADEGEARRLVEDTIVSAVRSWETHFPGATQRLALTLASFCTPACNCNIDPAVNYKALWEMKVNCLANHPAAFGLEGLIAYRAGRCDEETLRWIGRLFRHYAIEGETKQLGTEPFRLTHVVNSDFVEGTRGWHLSPAERGSMGATRRADGWGILQGRYRAPIGMGDTCLWTRRSAVRPNRFSQKIRDLKHGRLYSLKMYTGDFGEFTAGKSEPKTHAVSIQLDNAEWVNGPRRSFQVSCFSIYSAGPFTGPNPFYTNYYLRVFRARGRTAGLTVSDWKSETDPGGPVGQELVYNFVEIQPYLDD